MARTGDQNSLPVKRHGMLTRYRRPIFTPPVDDQRLACLVLAGVAEAIRNIEKRGSLVMAGRVFQTCGQIFRYAVATQRAKSDPSRDLRGALRTPNAVKHRSAMKASELGPFF